MKGCRRLTVLRLKICLRDKGYFKSSEVISLYHFQLQEIDAELETCTDLQKRNALMDSHSDLVELIELLTGKEVNFCV